MDFNKLIEFYERIAATTKRLEIIDTLAELFIECKKEENQKNLRKIVYLTQGRLVSEIEEWPKFGIAEKMIIQAMVKFTSKSANEIKLIINKKGDVGEAVQDLLEKQNDKKISYSLDAFTSKKQEKTKKFEIAHLYSELEKLSQIKGDGSQDAKIKLINGIIRLCTPQSAKYVINIILSNLRIGLADMSILDSLAIAFTSSKENRSEIQRAYNVYPDLGYIAEILLKKGLEGMKNVSITVGVPIRMMLASRIQYPQIQQKLGGADFIAEYKYDGERVQVHKKGEKIWLFSRQLKNITAQYPDIVESILKNIEVEEVIFEGELVAMDIFFEKMLPFQVMSQRRRKYDIKKMIKEIPVTLYCFDVLFAKDPKNEIYNGNCMNLPLIERREKLLSLFTPQDRIQYSHQKLLHSTDEMVEYFNEARNKGAEGIMNKALGPESIYKAGNRGFLWIKLKGLEGAKMLDSIDVVIIGASWGKGRRKGTLSTLFCAALNDQTEKFEYFTRVGSGFSDDDLSTFTEKLRKIQIEKPARSVICKDIPDIWVKPKVIIEVMGDELTISNKSDAGATHDNPNGYSLRFPVFQRIREDKDLSQITTTSEIMELYEAQ